MNHRKMSDNGFFTHVYKIVKKIPSGKVTTYGAIARFIGSPQSARMVGWAMNSSHHYQDFIPAHQKYADLFILQRKLKKSEALQLRVLEMAEKSGYTKAKTYAGKCHLCTSIRQFFLQNDIEKSIIGPKECYFNTKK